MYTKGKEGIRILISAYQELQQTPEMAISALVKKYMVSEKEAKELVKEYWK